MAIVKLLKKVWKRSEPYQQMGSLTLFILTGFVATIMFYSNLTQALVDVQDLKFWKQSTSVDLATIKQELHDVHEWIREDRQ